MNRSIKYMNRALLLACMPFLGAFIWFLSMSTALDLSGDAMKIETGTGSDLLPTNLLHEQISEQLVSAADTAEAVQSSIHKQLKLYKDTNDAMNTIAATAKKQAERPLIIYDQKITAALGKPAAVIQSDKLRAQLFYDHQANFRNYLVKIQLKSKNAMKMVLGGEIGKSNTTLEAVNLHKAAVGINAGGFVDSKQGRVPLSTTIIEGEYVNGGFESSYADLFFVGMDQSNKLIGGKFSTKGQLDKLKPKFGASFVPVLLKNGYSQTIPEKWLTSPARAPRTVIANYKDSQLLLLVTDGYNKGGTGAALEEIQALLKKYGAVDAYNLDGGGSSSLIFNGKVINTPSDGQLRKVPTHFLFFK